MSEELTAIRQDVNAIRRLMTELVSIMGEIKALSAKEQFQPASQIEKPVAKPQEPIKDQTPTKVTPPKTHDPVDEWIPQREEVYSLMEEWKQTEWGDWSAMREDYPDLANAIDKSYKETLDYGDYYFKMGGNEKQFINLKERKFKTPDAAPSEGQLKIATGRKIDPAGHTQKSLSIAIANADLAKRQ